MIWLLPYRLRLKNWHKIGVKCKLLRNEIFL